MVIWILIAIGATVAFFVIKNKISKMQTSVQHKINQIHAPLDSAVGTGSFIGRSFAKMIFHR
jgi:hypothetical protein